MDNDAGSMLVGSGPQECTHVAAQLSGIDPRASEKLRHEPQFAGQSIRIHAARLYFLQQVVTTKVIPFGQGLKKVLWFDKLAPRGYGLL
jgi:hypothetical protein